MCMVLMMLAGCAQKASSIVCPKPIWLPEALDNQLAEQHGGLESYRTWYVANTNMLLDLEECYDR